MPHLRDRSPRTFVIGDETIHVRVRESSRARTSRIIIGPRRPLEVIVRRRVSGSQVDAFLESHRSWITKKVAEARAAAARPRQLGLERPGVAWFAGEPLEIQRVSGRRSVAELRDRRLIVRGPNAGAVAAVERWYRRAARERLLAVAQRETARLGVDFRSLSVRDPKTRWGSCSHRGDLSFSWRLFLAPERVLEYVVVHELLHRREHDHSKAFWRLVETARPGWQEQMRWLRENGQELHDYRAALALP